jgi:hypothetical protein
MAQGPDQDAIDDFATSFHMAAIQVTRRVREALDELKKKFEPDQISPDNEKVLNFVMIHIACQAINQKVMEQIRRYVTHEPNELHERFGKYGSDGGTALLEMLKKVKLGGTQSPKDRTLVTEIATASPIHKTRNEHDIKVYRDCRKDAIDLANRVVQNLQRLST